MAKADNKEIVILELRTTRKEGFRRAGLHITREGIEVRADELTEGQLKALQAEPMVMVSMRSEPAPTDAK